MENKILEGNKLIAEFKTPNWRPNDEQAEELLYHSDWNWLMPVVIKLINYYSSCFYISGDGYSKHGFIGASLMDDSMMCSDTTLPVGQELQATWESVVSTLKKIKERK